MSRSTAGDAPVLQATHLQKRFGGVTALGDATVSLHRGEVVALVGDNGAGKSTFAKILCGAQPHDEGELLIHGQPTRLRNTRHAQALGISMVFQDLALCDNLDTIQNLFLGRELRTPWYLGRRLDRPAMEKRSRVLASELGVNIKNLAAPIRALSGGQRQAVAITRAVLSEPQIVILDEPTAALGVEKTSKVRETIEKLRDRGCAVLMISHDLAEVQHLADAVVVLRLGHTAARLTRGNYDTDELIAHITGARTAVTG